MSFASSTTQIFRNFNGEQVNLDVKNELKNKVITIDVRRNTSLHVGSELAKCSLFLVFYFFVNNLLALICGVALIWHYANFLTTVTKDTLLIMESVGMQITSKRRFFGLKIAEFLPWNTIQDVFINEVIIERKVLFFLTFIVESANLEKKSVRLVPLFREIRPERRCLEYIYNQLIIFIKTGKKS